MNRPGRRRQRRKRGCLRCGGLNAFGCLFLGLLCGMFALHNVVLRGDRFSLRASAREALALAIASAHKGWSACNISSGALSVVA